LTIEVSGYASKAEAAAAFWAALDGVEAVIDETYAWNPSAYTYETFLANYGLESTSAMKFISGKKVFRIDGTHTPEPNYGLDWYESRLAHPEWAVEGLKRAMGDASMGRYYFRNVAAGEVPEILDHEGCTLSDNELTQCAEGAYPEAIPMIFKEAIAEVMEPEADSDSSDTDSDSDSDSAAAVMFSVLTLFFGEF